MEFQLPFEVNTVMFRNIEGIPRITRKYNNEIIIDGLIDGQDSGYLRWDGGVNFSPMQKTCSIDYYTATSRYFLVIGLKDCKSDDILKHIQIVLAEKTASLRYNIISINVNGETIRSDETIKTDLELIKITFDKIEITANQCAYVLECDC